MKHFFIVTNSQKDKNLAVTMAAHDYLVGKGMTCVIQDEEQLELSYTDIAQIPENVECVLVLGGDGTLIQAARDVVKREIPLYEVSATRRIRRCGTVSRPPVYDATDYNYIRFDVQAGGGTWQYEVVNGQLYEYAD